MFVDVEWLSVQNRKYLLGNFVYLGKQNQMMSAIQNLFVMTIIHTSVIIFVFHSCFNHNSESYVTMGVSAICMNCKKPFWFEEKSRDHSIVNMSEWLENAIFSSTKGVSNTDKQTELNETSGNSTENETMRTEATTTKL